MSLAWTWCKKRAEAVSGARNPLTFDDKMALWVIFAANDTNHQKKR
ncbi:hypothetical protein SAMN05216563_102561 [Phytobacter palmae]|nr:hypothetical protein SAMN05216563_102561 [Phytobacter palmae]